METRLAIGIFLLLCLAIAAVIFASIARKKNRNALAWGFLGFLGIFGFIGFVVLLIILLCLPTLCPRCKKSLTTHQWKIRLCPNCGLLGEQQEKSDA